MVEYTYYKIYKKITKKEYLKKTKFGTYTQEPEYNPAFENDAYYKEYLQFHSNVSRNEEQELENFIKMAKLDKNKECDSQYLKYMYPQLRKTYCDKYKLPSTRQNIYNFCNDRNLPKNIHITPKDIYNYINLYDSIKYTNELMRQNIIYKFYNNINEINSVWCIYVKWLYCQFNKKETFGLTKKEIWQLKYKIKHFFQDLQMGAVALTTGIVFLYENNFIESQFPEPCQSLKTTEKYNVNGLIVSRSKDKAIKKVSGSIKKLKH